MDQDLAFELTDVTKAYGDPRGHHPTFVALRRVTLRIPVGGLTTIVGPSGSGKSTLLGLLGLLDRPTEGTLRILGQDTSTVSERRRCALRGQHLGFVFQAFHLMAHRTVLDNVMVGGLYRGLSRPERTSEAMRRLEAVGLRNKSTGRVETLSGGERQRVAIARALVGSPEVLLCDEPTGNLDSRNGEAVADLLVRLAGSGITVVMVTHDPSMAGLGDRTITVRDGEVTDHATS
ncbi:ABC transporter ATP-binding protein [Nocardioides sp. Iso805N]|uniref:ABC transporter ATP-binding protein n=1 Tax=Nocardioides sp. Iso805N TaxID=1283287 RepID=UPI0003742E6D|nr:ABC transporter ATP-binding protein [Nocardioides sp. Iso805N]